MQTANATLGGFANSLSELAAKIHHDLGGVYSLEYDLSPEDSDRGFPNVEVRLVRHDLRVAILDVVPVDATAAWTHEVVSKELLDSLRKTSKQPVSSPDFRITQHIDSFPLHAGLQQLLPMSGIVEWTGKGQAPRQVSVFESVEDLNLSTVILERDIQSRSRYMGPGCAAT